MNELAVVVQQKLDLTQDNRVLRSRIEEQDVLIAELSAKLAEREEHCKRLRRQRNRALDRVKEQSSREFLTRLVYTCVAVFLMTATIYSMNTLALLVMRWAALM